MTLLCAVTSYVDDNRRASSDQMCCRQVFHSCTVTNGGYRDRNPPLVAADFETTLTVTNTKGC
jgi:hypothetical protein